jgi:hypothetical protein
MSLQFSAHAEGTSGYRFNFNDDRDARFSGIMGAHLAMRDPNSHAIGVFGAFTGANNLDYCGANGGGLGGVEGQKYFGNLTLYGQVGGGGQFNNADCAMFDSYWFVRGVARYFIDPNLRLAAEISYADGKGQFNTPGASADINILSWGASIEHRLMNSPFSVFAEYAGDRIDGSGRGFCWGDNTVTQHTFLFGAKINFGEPTLLANDRRGATFDLPKFHRAMPWSWVSQSGLCI